MVIRFGPRPAPVVTTTWAEEDAGEVAHSDNPDGFCTKPCLGVSVLHPKHEDVNA